MKSSEQTNEISAALAKAQGAISNPSKDAVNPHFNSRFADLAAGLNAIREGFSANGLWPVQATRLEGDVLILETRLTHSSGQWFECEYPVCKFPSAPQAMGSAMTYARRYSLFPLVGIAGEDDDGNGAKDLKIEGPGAKAFITPEQVEDLDTLLVELGDEVSEGFKKFFKIEFLGRLPATDFTYAMKRLTATKKQREAAEEDKLIAAYKP